MFISINWENITQDRYSSLWFEKTSHKTDVHQRKWKKITEDRFSSVWFEKTSHKTDVHHCDSWKHHTHDRCSSVPADADVVSYSAYLVVLVLQVSDHLLKCCIQHDWIKLLGTAAGMGTHCLPCQSFHKLVNTEGFLVSMCYNVKTRILYLTLLIQACIHDIMLNIKHPHN